MSRAKADAAALKQQEIELNTLRSVRTMLVALQKASQNIRDDIASAVDNHASIQGTFMRLGLDNGN